MKPVIIYIKSDGKLDLTQEQLDKIISDAYQQGYNEGFYAGSKSINLTYTHTNIPDWWTVKYDQVTCSSECNHVPQVAESVSTTAKSAENSIETASEP